MHQRLVQVREGASQRPVDANRREGGRKPSEKKESSSMLVSSSSVEQRVL